MRVARSGIDIDALAGELSGRVSDHAGPGAHEALGFATGAIVWGVGALFLAAALAHRRGAFVGRAPVPFEAWSAVVAAGLSGGAAAIHFGLLGVHFHEFPPYGLAMGALAWFQALWAVAYVHRPTRGLAALAIAVQVGVLLVWLASRTVGLPFGPVPWQAEAVGAADALASTLEAALVALLAIRLSPAWHRAKPPLEPLSVVLYPGSVLICIAVATILVVAQPGGGHGTHEAAKDRDPVALVGWTP